MVSEENEKRPTLRDVARIAGVSAQTVSRVINEHPRVAQETRRRVQSAMVELGYIPNRAAQILNTRRSHILEVITVDTEDSAFRSTVSYLSAIALEYGYRIMFTVISGSQLRGIFGSVISRISDGVILIAPTQDLGISDEELMEISRGIPFVQIAATLGAATPSVVYDQAHGVRVLTQYLIDLGHTQIAAIPGRAPLYVAGARYEAWKATIAANNLEPGPVAYGDYTVETGYHATRQILASGKPFTALVAGNDRMALGAYYALHEAGLRIPDDVSVVGFDNIEHAPYYVPPLTTVFVDFKKLGQMAMEYLLNLIRDPDTPVHQQVLTPELIIRASTRAVE